MGVRYKEGDKEIVFDTVEEFNNSKVFSEAKTETEVVKKRGKYKKRKKKRVIKDWMTEKPKKKKNTKRSKVASARLAEVHKIRRSLQKKNPNKSYSACYKKAFEIYEARRR